MAHLMGSAMELQKVTIVSRGDALGYAFYLPEEDRYLHTKEELVDRMVVALAGRAAEEVVFGRVTNGAANDLEKVTEIARAMVFEWGMADIGLLADDARRQLRAVGGDEAAPRQRAGAPHRHARTPRRCGSCTSTASPLDRLAAALLEKETLVREEVIEPPRRRRAGVARVRHGRRSARRRLRRLRPRRSSIARVEARGIHHVGLAVADLDEAVQTYERLFGGRVEHRERVEEQGVEAASVRVGSSRVELLAALGDDTPVGKFLAKRGPGCTTSPTRSTTSARRSRDLAAAGAELIDAEPRHGMFGLEVAFVHPESVHGVLSEVVSRG